MTHSLHKGDPTSESTEGSAEHPLTGQDWWAGRQVFHRKCQPRWKMTLYIHKGW